MANTYFSNTGIDDALGGITATFISLHTGSPGTTGANEVSGGTYIRVATTWSPASGSSMTGAAVTINVPAATTIEYFGIWTASSGGTYIGGGPLQNDETYTGAGTYALTPTVSGSG